MVDYNNISKNHLANVIGLATGYTVEEGRADLTVVPNSGDVKVYIDNLVGFPQYNDEGRMIAGHIIQIRTANANYNTAHELLTDITYNSISAVDKAIRTLRPKLATKTHPWIKYQHDVNSFATGDDVNNLTSEIQFFMDLIYTQDDVV